MSKVEYVTARGGGSSPPNATWGRIPVSLSTPNEASASCFAASTRTSFFNSLSSPSLSVKLLSLQLKDALQLVRCSSSSVEHKQTGAHLAPSDRLAVYSCALLAVFAYAWFSSPADTRLTAASCVSIALSPRLS